MAEDEDGVSNKNPQQNSDKAGSSQENELNTPKPDLGIEEAKYNSNENGDTSPTEPRSSSSKTSGTIRKDENPFSFRHFLKRDLSLPGNSTYENTGARPKVYANTVQHSPTKTNLGGDTKRERPRPTEPQTKETGNNGSCHRNSDNTSSSSSVEIPFSVVDNSDSKNNFYVDNTDSSFFHRPNLASEPLGMPSLPDFVQDHILVEQAYLNPNGPLSVDLDNLPDFTFNTNFNLGASPSTSRRSASNYGGSRSYNYDSYIGAPSTSTEPGPSRNQVPLDLPQGADAAASSGAPPDLSAHLSLDLTESVNQDRRNVSPSRNFPLDLPVNAGAESMRLPDFLPVHPGRTSPEPEHEDQQLQQIWAELERTRSELFLERNRRSRLESELCAARDEVTSLRGEVTSLRGEVTALRGEAAAARGEASRMRMQGEGGHSADNARGNSDAETTIARLKEEIKILNESLNEASSARSSLVSSQAHAAGLLRRAAAAAQRNLGELMDGVEQLKLLSASLDAA